MKKSLIIIVFFITTFTFQASAQQPASQQKSHESFSVDTFKKFVGKKATLCDVVYSYKILSDTVTMLNMGGNYPNEKFTVVVTGKEIELNYDGLKGKHICVTGDLSLYDNKPQVMIYHTNQLEFK